MLDIKLLVSGLLWRLVFLASPDISWLIGYHWFQERSIDLESYFTGIISG